MFLAFLPLDTYIKSDERRIYYAGYELSRREASVTGKAFSKELKMESLLRLKTREEKKKRKGDAESFVIYCFVLRFPFLKQRLVLYLAELKGEDSEKILTCSVCSLQEEEAAFCATFGFTFGILSFRGFLFRRVRFRFFRVLH